jgi:hypothetical protein
MKTIRIYPSKIAAFPEYDNPPLHHSIDVYIDHDNYNANELNSLEDIIHAIQIPDSEDCGFLASDIWWEMEELEGQYSLVSIFTPLANDLQRLGMLDADGYLEISEELAAMLLNRCQVGQA